MRTGVSIGGDDSNRIVTLTGRRTLLTSRVLNLNSPGVEMDSETFEWPYISEFDIVLQRLIYEVKKVVINIAVVTNSMPSTGIPLPFISYGGTSIMILMAEMGLVLEIGRAHV